MTKSTDESQSEAEKPSPISAEKKRMLAQDSGEAAWQLWGPYLSERQWGTVREDYSENGGAWDYFSHDQARSRAYRWGERTALPASVMKSSDYVWVWVYGMNMIRSSRSACSA